MSDKPRYPTWGKEPVQLELPLNLPPIRCEHCGNKVPQPFYVEKHFGAETKQLPFCDEEHSRQYYLRMARREGL